MTGVVGAIQEAWGEVQVHRARVVLSLIGVFLAVLAMTIITAAGTMGRQAIVESTERYAGRDTTLSLYASPSEGTASDPVRLRQVYTGLVERFGVTWSSTVLQTGFPLQVGATTLNPNVYVVEPDYGPIHRIVPVQGRWFVEADAERLAPAMVVNEGFLAEAGLVGRAPPFAVDVPSGTAVVVGVVQGGQAGPDGGSAFSEVHLLASGPQVVAAGGADAGAGDPSLEMWVPPEAADEITAAVPAALEAQGYVGEAYPLGDATFDTVLSGVQWGLRAVSLFALGLGALGVLNVGIVTVRQRVREIGVRRALGASSGRVFAAIMLESVVATAVAGALGVAVAVAIVVNLPESLVAGSLGISEVPPFPFSAALEGFLSATAVGALVGLVPATMAVRAKVIDAIRY